MNKDEVLYSIKHHDEWPEELLSDEWSYFVDKVLSPKERIVLENKVEGYSNNEIARLFGSNLKNIQDVISSVKSKLKNEMSVGGKVDNWVRREEWKESKKKSGRGTK